MRRWDCPNGEHAGVLAPERMAKDDVRRYCLECSVESGRLEERVSPALERKRQEAEERRKEKAAARRQAKLEKKCLASGLNPETVFSRARRMPCWKAENERAARRLLRATMRQVWTNNGASGRAYTGRNHISVKLGKLSPDTYVVLLILHELTHLFLAHSGLNRVTGRCTRASHGRNFHALLLEAAKCWWPNLDEDAVWEEYGRRHEKRRADGYGAYVMDAAIQSVVRLQEDVDRARTEAARSFEPQEVTP